MRSLTQFGTFVIIVHSYPGLWTMSRTLKKVCYCTEVKRKWRKIFSIKRLNWMSPRVSYQAINNTDTSISDDCAGSKVVNKMSTIVVDMIRYSLLDIRPRLGLKIFLRISTGCVIQGYVDYRGLLSQSEVLDPQTPENSCSLSRL